MAQQEAQPVLERVPRPLPEGAVEFFVGVQ